MILKKRSIFITQVSYYCFSKVQLWLVKRIKEIEASKFRDKKAEAFIFTSAFMIAA